MSAPPASAGLPHNPRADESAPYPFTRLDEHRKRLRARGVEPIDLSIGDPREPTPQFIRDALAAALTERSSYPTVAGRPTLRRTIAAWLERRYGVGVDPDTQILPANGSKEAIFHLPLLLLDAGSARRRVVIPTPAYPVYERGARLAGGVPTPLPLAARHRYLPDFESVPEAVWRETALLWLNYPHNPSGATATRAVYEEALALGAQHGLVVASDEAYAELYFDTPPPSLLQCGGERALVFHTLSKRSAMTGYRSGFVAGDGRLIARYRALRASFGVATPEFVQVAAEAAWSEETHVEAMRRAFADKRAVFLPWLEHAGYRVFPSSATFFLWVEAPGGDDVAEAERWFEAGVLPLPGSWLGEGGAGFLRLALVPTLEECTTAVARLRERVHG